MMLTVCQRSILFVCHGSVSGYHGLDWTNPQTRNHHGHSRKSISLARSHESREYLLCHSRLAVGSVCGGNDRLRSKWTHLIFHLVSIVWLSRYVIFPIQVLARSCKPVPVLLIGTLLGKKYPRRKYISVFLIVCGVAMFMGGGNILKGGSSDDSSDDYDTRGSADSSSLDTALEDEDDDSSITPMHKQIFGVALLIASLFFDGGTGAYEDKLMSMHSVEPFDLMFKFSVSKAILAALLLIVFNQMHLFVEMIRQTGICTLSCEYQCWDGVVLSN